MSDRKWFTPTENMQIVDPLTRKPVPPHGKWVSASDEFFIRRELDGGGKLTDTAPAGVDPEA